jgi:hypothetical protein
MGHPATDAILRYFDCEHLPKPLYEVAVRVRILAHELIGLELSGPELTAGLRKLLEAKDCFVRAALDK